MSEKTIKNKQWAINKIDEAIEIGKPLQSSEINDGYVEGCEYSQRVIDMMDESKKVIVPYFVASWFEENKDDLDFAIYAAVAHSIKESQFNHYPEGFMEWIELADNNPIETLIRMKDGYVIDKEPLYYVYLPEILTDIKTPDIEGSYLMRSDDEIELADNNSFDEMKFTESEIKALDERYWAFAVPVDADES